MTNDFKEELGQMDLRLTEMEEKINSIDTKLTQVVDAILGNPLTKTGGFINDIEVLKQKIEILEKKQETYEDFKKRIMWTAGIIFAIFIIIQYVTSIYTNIKN
jgi:hypothetical protein